MDNKTFNDCIINLAAKRMVAQGYANSVEEATTWLNNRKAQPCFNPRDSSFSERGAVNTLTRLCNHAYEIIIWRRDGSEIELSNRVKAYYTPIFEKAGQHA